MARKKRRVITEGARRMGRGSERVYAYTFSSYRRESGPYPIKVGMTRGNSAERRIAAQIGASNAETPILLLEISCENAARLERSLHSRLKSRHITDVPGKEWFSTTPAEITRHLRALDPSTVETFGQAVMVLVGWLWRSVCAVTSSLWQLFWWAWSASGRTKRQKRSRRWKRVKRRAEETLAKTVLWGGLGLAMLLALVVFTS